MKPDISVIIPTFRREQQLVEALSSVLGQARADTEVFVVDDSPEGSARDVVSQIGDKRVRYHKNPLPTGGNPSIVRNRRYPSRKRRSYTFSTTMTSCRTDITLASRPPLRPRQVWDWCSGNRALRRRAG